jgi:predicted ester cyclase
VGLLVLALSAVPVGCADPGSDISSANKEIVRQWFTALDAQDYGALTVLMDEHFVVPTRVIDGPNRATGRDETFEMIRGFYRSFPDYTHEIQDLIAEGDRVAARVILRGSHLGEYSGVAATGVRVSYAGTYMMTLSDGVLTEVWSLDDEINLLTQLGMELTRAEP